MGASSSRKLWIRLIFVLVGIELMWVIGANWALSSELVIGKINHRPEKLLVQWGKARTYLPGVIHLHDLSVRGQSRKQQWYVELGQGRVHMSLLALAFKTFKTYGVNGSGIDFRLRKRQLPDTPASKAAKFAPEIPGLAVDSPPFPPKKKRKQARPWTISLGGVDIDEFRQLWILGIRLTANGRVGADMNIELSGGPMEMEHVRMDLSGAELTILGNITMQEVQLGLDARIEPFFPKEAKGLDVLKRLTGSVSLHGTSKGAGLINSLLADFEEVEVGSPGGQVESELCIVNGVLHDGTSIRFTADGGWVDILDWRASGRLRLDSQVTTAEGELATTVSLALTEVEFADRDSTEPLLAGADLTLDASSGALDVSGGVQGIASAVESIRFDLTEAEVTDITRLPIPAFEDLSLDSGAVSVESHVSLTRQSASSASLEVQGRGIGASCGEVVMSGDFSLDLTADTKDLSMRRLDFSDSLLRIDNVTIQDGKRTEEDWYLHIEMPAGILQLKPGGIVTSAQLRMTDTRPLIALLGQEKMVLNRLKGVLNFKDVEGEADIEMAAQDLQIENFEIDSEGLEVKANLRIHDKEADGIVYTKFHGIGIGLDLRGQGTDLKLLHPLRWYEQQTVRFAGQESSVTAAD